LEELGVDIFRLNLSHTRPGDIASTLQYIKSRTAVPICLDTEGAQVRSGSLVDGKVTLRENSLVRLHRHRVPGDPHNFNLYPTFILDLLEVGDVLSMDEAVLAQVMAVEDRFASLRVLCGGDLGQNKAVTVQRDIPMPALTPKDRKALAIARELDIHHLALSFAHRAEDVDEIRNAFGAEAFVISKIECQSGLRNLEAIAAKSDALLIDRGDLSRQVPIEQIPRVQKEIIRSAKETGTRVYVATNLMESMVSHPYPTRAEVNDVYNTLRDGADGLVLASETAVGSYPIGCASMVVRITREFENVPEDLGAAVPSPPISLLMEPLGGSLRHRELPSVTRADLVGLPSLSLPETDFMDCELLGNGTYSPLTGFMNRETLESVLHSKRLPDGLPWTMPILLPVHPDGAGILAHGGSVRLEGPGGKGLAVLRIESVYSVELEDLTMAWFGTTSMSHPGVARVAARRTTFVSGEVEMVEGVPSPFDPYKLTPAMARFIFAKKGWSKVVGFHSRNVPHRIHELIQQQALDSTHADGLFISPVIGPQKQGDFLPGPILKSYQLLLDFGYYPRGKVVLGAFATYPRFCGPREAVFTAICRRNMGCSHFIVGRDHAGVGGFYDDRDTRALFDELGDLGVQPVFFEMLGYDPSSRSYRAEGAQDLITISGSEAREALRQQRELPQWFMHDLVQESIRESLAKGEDVFCE
jgi:ATP sulfurylase